MLYRFKDAIKRGSALLGAVGMVAGIASSALPVVVSADALNPLTERTLLLSSSSPGFHYLDGANNPTYAIPGSGPNGKQTGETFSFKVSTDSRDGSGTGQALKAFTFQYCTAAAGECASPGDDSGTTLSGGTRGSDVTNADGTGSSDLNVNYPSPAEVLTKPTNPTDASPVVARDDSQGNFGIYVNGALNAGWTLAASNLEDSTTVQTGKNNLITLTNATSTLKPAPGDLVEVVFYATDNNYITNPGSGDFFVKINDYNDNTDVNPTTSTHIVDGGVTVANVMTDSIQIQTKVLETMSFSVGTRNPDLYPLTGGSTHGPCDIIEDGGPIKLGNAQQENSLETTRAYDATSYWRLSSNSSNGATVYYSGYTLSNTENDQIAAVGTTPGDGSAVISHPGEEQFGLALMSDDPDGSLDTTTGTAAHNQLTPLVASGNYGAGDGAINSGDTGWGTLATEGKFAFKYSSATVPEALASENSSVVGCTTGKMRYLANIAATTPAGIYTTKINYLAAPQY